MTYKLINMFLCWVFLTGGGSWRVESPHLLALNLCFPPPQKTSPVDSSNPLNFHPTHQSFNIYIYICMHSRGYSRNFSIIQGYSILVSIESLAPTLSYFIAFLSFKRSVNYTYFRHVRKL